VRVDATPATPGESVREAIEVMTAWLAEPDGPPDLLAFTLRQHLDDCPPEQALAAAARLIAGLTNLCGTLLALHEEAGGLDMHAILQELGHHYATE
jgi:hypothetical protein